MEMITAIIQARMSSTRLPGKVMKCVRGKPLLSFLLRQLLSAKNVGRIVIATTTSEEDDAIYKFCQDRSVDVYRGSQRDVLDRYYQAARIFGAQNIMRITADCPLIDPKICDALAEKFLSEQVDYAYTDQSFAEGLDCEVFSMSSLSKVHEKARAKSQREHVTLYFKDHPEEFKVFCLRNSVDDSRFRVTVDEPQDFEVVKAIIEGLASGENVPFVFDDVRRFLKDHVDVSRMNAHILRNEGLVKSLMNDGEF